MLLSIDPGAHPGFALFDEDSKELVECATVLPDTSQVFTIACELPVIYPRSKANPNTIITLAITAGMLVGQFRLPVRWVPAREWKSQIPKTTKVKDYIVYKNIMKVLNSHEKKEFARALALVNQKDGLDIVDAVGIGLYVLGRL